MLVQRIALPGSSAPSAGYEAPFEMLAACHERVERMLKLLARLRQHLQDAGCDEPSRQAARDVMRYFDQAAPLHHQDEELHVFPPLLAGPDASLCKVVQGLLQDHRAMEVAWGEARLALQAVAECHTGEAGSAGPVLSADGEAALERFAALYAQHLQAEDQLVYPAAQALLSGPDLQRMSADMMARRGLVVAPGATGLHR